MSNRIRQVALFLLLASVAAVAAAWLTVSSNEERAESSRRVEVREADRDSVRKDVRALEKRLAAHSRSVGHDVMPVRDEPVLPPKGISENLISGTLEVGDFRDVFIDEGMVLRGLRVREVDEIRLQRESSGRTPPPYRPKPGFRLLQVDLHFTNRSGDAADPACGLSGGFTNRAVTDDGEAATILDSYGTVGTYEGGCNAGIADGTSGTVALAVGMRDKDRLKALQFMFLGEESDQLTQVLVLEDAA